MAKFHRVQAAPAPLNGEAVDASLACSAVALPVLLAFNLPPSATFLNQAAAVIGWGGWMAVLAAALPARTSTLVDKRPGVALLCALGLLAVSMLGSPLWTGLPSTLALSSAAMIAAAALVAIIAALAQSSGAGRAAFGALCFALVVAGVASTAVGVVQVFAPEWTGGHWIAQAAADGRAVGNLRQPNHLSSLLLWSMIAAIWRGETGVVKRPAMLVIWLLLLLGLVLCASRTGMVGVAVLALWGALDRHLARTQRLLLCLAPVAFALVWLALSVVGGAADTPAGFSGGKRFEGGSFLATTRFAIWLDTLALIAAQPWFGVGPGEFNLAWTLTPFAARSGEFFDHTHNLPLQFAVELGLPLAALVLALLSWALWGAFKAARDANDRASHLRAAFVMLLMIVLHSQFEYPLWYAYFLLPTAFVLGLCLGEPAEVTLVPTRASPRLRPLMIAALLLMLGGFASVLDYHRVVVIFAPSEGAPPLEERIAAGRRSMFFGHHADYAAATSAPDPAAELPAFGTATHYLLDTRLMLAWAEALAASGDTERARHIAQRLREFRNPASHEFFAACLKPPADAASAPPFQCTPPTTAFDYRDFR